MALDQTTRLGIYTWTSGSDPFTRDQMTESHEQLEDLVAVFQEGLLINRPEPSAINIRSFYRATDNNVIYYSTGAGGDWYPLNAYAPAVSLTVGGANSAGSNSTHTVARSDHTHALPPYGVVGEITQIVAPSTGPAAGTADKFARVDHRHILADGSVTANKIAAGGINSSSQFAAGIVNNSAIGDNVVTKDKISTDQQIPSGTMMMFAGTTLPSGWLWCDGSLVSTTTYVDLFNAVGYRYGGSGGTFALPDVRNRVPRGAATTSTSVSTLSNDSLILSQAQLPAHTHAPGTLAISTAADHNHELDGSASGAVAVNVPHAHTIHHNHSGRLSNNYVNQSGLWGTGIADTGGGSGVPVAIGDLGYGALWLQNRNAFVADSNVTIDWTYVNSGTDNATHGHSLTGRSRDAGSHTHTLSGATASGPGSGATIDLRPSHVTVNYIIKI